MAEASLETRKSESIEIPTEDIMQGEVGSLKLSLVRVGPIYPVLEDAKGEVIDGRHRLKADKNWPRRRLETIKTRFERAVVRFHANQHRRKAGSKSDVGKELREIQLASREEHGRLLTSSDLAWHLGIPESTIRAYLPPDMVAFPKLARHGMQNPSVRMTDPSLDIDTGLKINCPLEGCGVPLVLIHRDGRHSVNDLSMSEADDKQPADSPLAEAEGLSEDTETPETESS